jgi:hypothetical protein
MVRSMGETDQPNLETLLSALHDSEIDGAVSWFYDGVGRVTLGDPHDGIDAQAVVGSIGEAVGWLRSTAVRLYPDSTFARKYAHGFE